jgi:hypothetical protein
LRDEAGVHDHHDQANHDPPGIDRAQRHRGPEVTEVEHQYRGTALVGETVERIADGVVFVGTHGALAEPEQFAFFVMQGDCMRARRLERSAHLLAYAVEIDLRVVRRQAEWDSRFHHVPRVRFDSVCTLPWVDPGVTVFAKNADEFSTAIPSSQK